MARAQKTIIARLFKRGEPREAHAVSPARKILLEQLQLALKGIARKKGWGVQKTVAWFVGRARRISVPALARELGYPKISTVNLKSYLESRGIPFKRLARQEILEESRASWKAKLAQEAKGVQQRAQAFLRKEGVRIEDFREWKPAFRGRFFAFVCRGNEAGEHIPAERVKKILNLPLKTVASKAKGTWNREFWSTLP